VAPLLGAFKNMLLTNPAPVASVIFLFYALRSSADAEPQLQVKVSFSETPWDAETIESLEFTADQLEGHVSLEEFKAFVDWQVGRWDEAIGKGEIEEKCGVAYDHK